MEPNRNMDISMLAASLLAVALNEPFLPSKNSAANIHFIQFYTRARDNNQRKHRKKRENNAAVLRLLRLLQHLTLPKLKNKDLTLKFLLSFKRSFWILNIDWKYNKFSNKFNFLFFALLVLLHNTALKRLKFSGSLVLKHP